MEYGSTIMVYTGMGTNSCNRLCSENYLTLARSLDAASLASVSMHGVCTDLLLVKSCPVSSA